jgi:hypothetical protein
VDDVNYALVHKNAQIAIDDTSEGGGDPGLVLFPL